MAEGGEAVGLPKALAILEAEGVVEVLDDSKRSKLKVFNTYGFLQWITNQQLFYQTSLI